MFALNRYLLLKTLNSKRARRTLPGFLELIEQLDASPLKGLARTLISWLESIVAMWRFSKSNGITEGFHTKMEMMTRRTKRLSFDPNQRPMACRVSLEKRTGHGRRDC